MANSVDSDEMPHSVASHLGLLCLLFPVCRNTYGKYGRYVFVTSNINFDAIKYLDHDVLKGLLNVLEYV